MPPKTRPISGSDACVRSFIRYIAIWRGYAICRDPQGTILKDATAVSRGDKVDVRLTRGTIGCLVESVEDTSGPSVASVSAPSENEVSLQGADRLARD